MAKEYISLEGVIKYAIMSEKNCCFFYRSISKLLEGGRLSKFFKDLADDELSHLEDLLILIDNGKIEEQVLHSNVTVNSDVFEKLINESWNPYGLSEEELLYLAAEREKLLIESYKIIKNIKSAPIEIINTAEKIGKLEQEHLEKIRKKIDELSGT